MDDIQARIDKLREEQAKRDRREALRKKMKGKRTELRLPRILRYTRSYRVHLEFT